MNLSFHGAARKVTGSCFLVECAGRRILIDCGLYQGGGGPDDTNAKPFGFDPAEIDYLLLTHAHLDHCGRIPLLVKQGFKGEIITTAPSRELAQLIMLDSASLQEADSRYRARKAARRKKNKRYELAPLYSVVDALDSIKYFGRTAVYAQRLELAQGISMTFLDAGHILGAASILLELEEKGRRKKVLFSGDLGSGDWPILNAPARPPDVDIVVMETTYGDRFHKSRKASLEEFYTAIVDGFNNGGNIIIPTFALERSQEILYYLREAVEANRVPPNMQVFLDSPMTISATQIFERYWDYFNAETVELFRKGSSPFYLPGLHYTRETAESMALNRLVGGAVIMAGSGMCTGGRVIHHLKHNLWRKNSSIVFVGYAVNGTLARKIIDGSETVRIYGEEIRVRAHIYTINGFSAHADQGELMAWHAQTGNPKKTFLVHGEVEVTSRFAKQLKDTEIIIPECHEVFEL